MPMKKSFNERSFYFVFFNTADILREMIFYITTNKTKIRRILFQNFGDQFNIFKFLFLKLQYFQKWSSMCNGIYSEAEITLR